MVCLGHFQIASRKRNAETPGEVVVCVDEAGERDCRVESVERIALDQCEELVTATGEVVALQTKNVETYAIRARLTAREIHSQEIWKDVPRLADDCAQRLIIEDTKTGAYNGRLVPPEPGWCGGHR